MGVYMGTHAGQDTQASCLPAEMIPAVCLVYLKEEPHCANVGRGRRQTREIQGRGAERSTLRPKTSTTTNAQMGPDGQQKEMGALGKFHSSSAVAFLEDRKGILILGD